MYSERTREIKERKVERYWERKRGSKEDGRKGPTRKQIDLAEQREISRRNLKKKLE